MLVSTHITHQRRCNCAGWSKNQIPWNLRVILNIIKDSWSCGYGILFNSGCVGCEIISRNYSRMAHLTGWNSFEKLCTKYMWALHVWKVNHVKKTTVYFNLLKFEPSREINNSIQTHSQKCGYQQNLNL